MRKYILILIVILFLLAVGYIIGASSNLKHDQYGCVAEKVLNECKEKEIWVSNEKATFEKSALIKTPYLKLEGGNRTKKVLKDYLAKQYTELIKPSHEGKRILGDYLLLVCEEAPDLSIDDPSNKRLTFRVDHFLWQGGALDCATEYNFIKSLFNLTIFSFSLISITLISLPIILILNKKYHWITIIKNKK